MKCWLSPSFFFLLIIWPALFYAATSGQYAIQWDKFESNEFPVLKGFVSVKKNNGIVSGLLPEQFSLSEDDVPESSLIISTEKLSIAIVVDNSGSMKDSMQEALAAVRFFVTQLRPSDQISLVYFNDKVQIVQPLTQYHSVVLQKLAHANMGNGTALYDSVVGSLETLRASGSRSVVVLLTDGQDGNREGTRAGSKTTLDQCIAACVRQKIPIFAIGLGRWADMKVLRKISDETGGASLACQSPEQLKQVYEKILDTISLRYQVTYKSHDPRNNGTLRKVKLKIKTQAGEGEGSTSYWVSQTGKPISATTIQVQKPPEIISLVEGSLNTINAEKPALANMHWGVDSKNFKLGKLKVEQLGHFVLIDLNSLYKHPEGKLVPFVIRDGKDVLLEPGFYNYVWYDENARKHEKNFEIKQGILSSLDLSEEEQE